MQNSPAWLSTGPIVRYPLPDNGGRFRQRLPQNRLGLHLLGPFDMTISANLPLPSARCNFLFMCTLPSHRYSKYLFNQSIPIVTQNCQSPQKLNISGLFSKKFTLLHFSIDKVVDKCKNVLKLLRPAGVYNVKTLICKKWWLGKSKSIFCCREPVVGENRYRYFCEAHPWILLLRVILF